MAHNTIIMAWTWHKILNVCIHSTALTWSARHSQCRKFFIVMKVFRSHTETSLFATYYMCWHQVLASKTFHLCFKVYRKTHGEHVGFSMFMDAILLSLSRKVNLE